MEIRNLPIPDVEKSNILALMRLINQIGGSEVLEVELVGGVLNQKWPRKDIDLTVRLTKSTGNNELEKATNSLERLHSILEKVCGESKGLFNIKDQIEPHMEHFEDPNILMNTGTIIISPRTGTPLEIRNKI